jgi:hypothetical protein
MHSENPVLMLHVGSVSFCHGIRRTVVRSGHAVRARSRAGITDEHLIPGARIVMAAMVVEAMANGASTLGF